MDFTGALQRYLITIIGNDSMMCWEREKVFGVVRCAFAHRIRFTNALIPQLMVPETAAGVSFCAGACPAAGNAAACVLGEGAENAGAEVNVSEPTSATAHTLFFTPLLEEKVDMGSVRC